MPGGRCVYTRDCAPHAGPGFLYAIGRSCVAAGQSVQHLRRGRRAHDAVGVERVGVGRRVRRCNRSRLFPNSPVSIRAVCRAAGRRGGRVRGLAPSPYDKLARVGRGAADAVRVYGERSRAESRGRSGVRSNVAAGGDHGPRVRGHDLGRRRDPFDDPPVVYAKRGRESMATNGQPFFSPGNRVRRAHRRIGHVSFMAVRRRMVGIDRDGLRQSRVGQNRAVCLRAGLGDS